MAYSVYSDDFGSVIGASRDLVKYVREGEVFGDKKEEAVHRAWHIVGYALGQLMPLEGETVWTATPEGEAIKAMSTEELCDALEDKINEEIAGNKDGKELSPGFALFLLQLGLSIFKLFT